MLILGFVLGFIFYNVKDDFSGVEEKVGLFVFMLMFLFLCIMEVLLIFL